MPSHPLHQECSVPWGGRLRGAHTEQGDAVALQHPQRAAALPLAWQACSLVLNLGAGGTAGCPSGLEVGTAGTLTPPQSQNSWVTPNVWFFGQPQLCPQQATHDERRQSGGGLGVFWAPKEEDTSVLMACW